MGKVMRTIGNAVAVLAVAGLQVGPALAQVRSIDPNAAIDADVRGPQEAPRDASPRYPDAAPTTPPATSPNATVAGDTARSSAPVDPSRTTAAADTFKRDDLIGAGEDVFGKGAEGFGSLIEKILKEQGEPNAYIAGREASGAFILGLRYGSGIMTHKVEGQRPVYWTGPSVGFDVGGDALLVMPEDQATGGYERVGSGMVWAGVARLDPARLGELAVMPRDYDVQSTLVRLASQARAVHVMLPQEAVRGGHGVGHAGAALEARGRTVMAAMISGRNGWFERFVTAPLARAVIPLLVPRTVPVAAVAGGAGAIGVAGLALTLFDQPVAGLLLTLLAALGLSLAATLADLRDESASARLLDLSAKLLPAGAAILYGFQATQFSGDRAAEILGIGLVLLAVLGERALGTRPRRLWWGSAPAYLGCTWLGALFAAPVAGLGLAAIYAAATLTAAIERLRRQP